MIKVVSEHSHMDKSGWGDGDWQREPDKVQGIDEATGYDVLIVRNHLGSLCGYVGVPKGHPYFGVGYDEVPAEAHGGLTFAGHCQEGAEEKGVCHVPRDGHGDEVWWLGFDCCHYMDRSPALDADMKNLLGDREPWEWETYKNRAYVEQEIEALASQLARATLSPDEATAT